MLEVAWFCMVSVLLAWHHGELPGRPSVAAKGVVAFLKLAPATFWGPEVVPAPYPDRGRVRTLASTGGAISAAALRGFAMPRVDHHLYSCQVAAAVLLAAVVRGWLVRRRIRRTARVGARLMVAKQPLGAGHRVLLLLSAVVARVLCVEGGAHIIQEASVQYQRADLYTGLPMELMERVDEITDGRLSTSSERSIAAALAQWDAVRGEHDWERVILTDAADRGAKLVTFVLHMLDDTTLSFGSIANYLWGFCTWNQRQRQADPRRGGNARAQNNLGYMHGQGEGGPQDFAEARRLYGLAADQGNPDAQINLGYMHEHGEGGPPDFAEARRLYGLAADQGNPEAQNNLAELSKFQCMLGRTGGASTSADI